MPTLRFLRDLYAAFPDEATAVRPGLTLSHYRLLVPIPAEERRAFYADACARVPWRPKQLKQVIARGSYERFAPSPEAEARARALIAETDPDGVKEATPAQIHHAVGRFYPRRGEISAAPSLYRRGTVPTADDLFAVPISALWSGTNARPAQD